MSKHELIDLLQAKYGNEWWIERKTRKGNYIATQDIQYSYEYYEGCGGEAVHYVYEYVVSPQGEILEHVSFADYSFYY